MEGAKLKTYLDQKRVNKTALAKALGMSKQNLYQLFASRQLEAATKNKIERELKVKWENIDGVNIDLKAGQPVQEAQPEPDHLTKLADAAYLGQKNVERMIAMLEEKEKALADIKASLAMVQPNMIALTEKIREGQRDHAQRLAAKIDELAAGIVRSNKPSPRVKH
jgi:hypothetical protein